MWDFLRPFGKHVADAVRRFAHKGAVACFDADWTLWNYDLGEAFLRWVSAGGLLPARPAGLEAYEEYLRRVRENRCEGYAFATKVLAGLSESDVERWSRQLAAAWPSYRKAMVDLLLGLHANGVECFVISATADWTVKAALEYLGFPRERVFGMRVAVEAGVLTDRLLGPITCGEGKVEAIERYVGRMPDLAFGDSLGDLPMLEASRQPIVVATLDRQDSELARIAKERGWPILVIDTWG